MYNWRYQDRYGSSFSHAHLLPCSLALWPALASHLPLVATWRLVICPDAFCISVFLTFVLKQYLARYRTFINCSVFVVDFWLRVLMYGVLIRRFRLVVAASQSWEKTSFAREIVSKLETLQSLELLVGYQNFLFSLITTVIILCIICSQILQFYLYFVSSKLDCLYRCFTTDSLPWGYLGQLFGLSVCWNSMVNARDHKFILIWALEFNLE